MTEGIYRQQRNCVTCGIKRLFAVPKGKTPKTFFEEKKEHICENCGCKFFANPAPMGKPKDEEKK